jgi:hypothetical protein
MGTISIFMEGGATDIRKRGKRETIILLII